MVSPDSGACVGFGLLGPLSPRISISHRHSSIARLARCPLFRWSTVEAAGAIAVLAQIMYVYELVVFQHCDRPSTQYQFDQQLERLLYLAMDGDLWDNVIHDVKAIGTEISKPQSITEKLSARDSLSSASVQDICDLL